MKAVAYLRTSSMANVSKADDDKDSRERQIAAIRRYAATRDIDVVGEFYDAGVPGSIPVNARPGFASMMQEVLRHDVHMILVETASRFARDLLVQETGHAYLKQLGVSLVAVDDPEAFLLDTPSAVLIRQVVGAVSQFEKANLVAKLKRGRDLKRELTGRCGGLPPVPQKVKQLARQWRAEGLSLRAVSSKLAEAGHYVNARRHKKYAANSILRMLD